MADDAKLIAALELKFDRFLKQLDDAGKAADKAVKDIEDKFSRANPQIGGAVFGGTFFGNIAAKAGRELLSFLAEIPEKFQAIQKAAEIAGVSMAKAFELVGTLRNADDAAKILENIGLQLERIRQGEKENKLAEFLSANNVTIAKDANAVLEQIGQTLQRTNASAAQLAEAGKRLGIPAEALKKLQENAGKSAEEIEKLRNLSEQAGAAIKAAGELIESAWTRVAIANLQAGAAMAEWARNTLLGLSLVAGATGLDAVAEKFNTLARGINTFADGARAKIELLRGELAKLGLSGPAKPTGTLKLPFDSGADAKSALEREEDRINKRIKLLQAETETIGKNTFEREKARASAELLAAIEKDGAAATDEQKKKIDDLSTSYARAAEAADEAHRRFQAGVDIARTVGSALSNAFADAIVEGKKFSEVMNSLVKTLEKAAINAAFGSLFGGQPGGLGNLLGEILKGKAMGGPVSGGNPYIVGEQGPEIFVPRGAGQIIPSGITKGALGGYTSAPVFNIDASGADPAAISRLERALVEVNATIESRARRIMYEDRRRRL